MKTGGARNLTGGLNTTADPRLLAPEATPDSENVLFYGGAAEKRGGFTPLFKDRMPANSVRAKGFRSVARDRVATVGVANVDYLIAPACMIAGHRDVYDSQTALSFDLFFEIERGSLIGQHGGNSATSAVGLGGPAPFKISLRPILSKGPVKRTIETAGNRFANAAIAWNTTASTVWGTASGSGMPFCLYVWNSGSGASPTWQFRLSAHVLVAGSWTLQTVTSGVVPQEGGRYHIVGVVSGSRVALRIARLYAGEEPSYTANETTFSGTLATNLCPIQVFDCPQQFVEATNVGSATQRPGLNIAAGGALGGYFLASKRAEGKVEDIAIWSGDMLASDATALDRVVKLEDSNAAINYWSMLGSGWNFVREQTGRGNHLYMVPAGPVTDTASGGKDDRSWFFNGQTSYASVDLGGTGTDGQNRNWNYADEAHTLLAPMLFLVRNSFDHGFAVDFWVDSIEPQFEQVVAEIHSVMRLAVRPDGKLVAYCRDGDTGPANTAIHNGENYQGPVVSNITVRPGHRYSVVVFRTGNLTTPGQLDLYVAGALDNSLGGINLVSRFGGAFDSLPLSGITLGMGGYSAMIRGPTPDDTGIAAPNQFNTDHRSGFVGRIESFKLITSSDGIANCPVYKREGDTDWRFSESRGWINPSGTRDVISPSDSQDTVREAGEGLIAKVSGHIFGDGSPIRYAVDDAATSAQSYGLHRLTQTLATAGTTGRMGHDSVFGIGILLYHVLAYWRLSVDDRDENYSGAYTPQREYRYPATSTPVDTDQTTHPSKDVHIQVSNVEDSTGTLGGLIRHCAESDIADEGTTVIFTGSLRQAATHRQRPYRWRSPLELAPKWSPGMVTPRPGQNQVSLLTDWEQQEGGRRLTVTASGRSIYWAKPLWEQDSPYAESPRRCVWMQGGYGSHVFAVANSAELGFTGTGTKTTVVVELWVKPTRLDGRRLIAAKTDPTTSQSQHNWVISTTDGSIEVMGTLGAGTSAWAFTEGYAAALDTDVKRTQTLRANAWNHLHVTMSTAGVTVRVNGQSIPMVDGSTLAGAALRDVHTSAAGDTAGTAIYLGGLPLGRERMTLTTAAPLTLTYDMQSWCGFVADMRIRNATDSAAGTVPRARLQDDVNTYLLLPMNEGEGWLLTNGASLSSGDNAHSQVAEFYEILSNLEDSQDHRYSSLVFRDRLMVSNGESRPHQIRFTNLAEDRPLVAEQLGLLAPVAHDTLVLQGSTTAGSAITVATYQVSMSFLTFDGLESEPVLLGSYVHSVATDTLALRIARLPRSPDPQVVGRRLYVSTIGGGNPVFNRDLDENDGWDHSVAVIATTGVAAVAGERLPAPRGRHLAVAGSSLVVGDLPDQPAGQNAFAFSTPQEPSQFALTSFVTIDSQDGKPLIGIRGNLGQTYLSKRDSVHLVSVGAIVSAVDVEGSLRLVFNSDGVGGGSAGANNLIYGSGDRGIFVFDGSTPQPISGAIERTWNDQVDRTDAGLFAQQGQVRRRRSEYWLSWRGLGESVLTRVFVNHFGGGGAWALLTLPNHTVLASLSSLQDQSQILAIGTDSGAILGYDEAVLIDHADLEADAQGAVVLTADTGITGTGSMLEVLGARFPTVLGGLRGASVSVVHDGVTEVRRVLRNTEDRIYLDRELVGWTGTTSFVVGGYLGRWSTGYLTAGQPNGEQVLKRLGIECLPKTGNLTVRVAATRQGDATVAAFPAAAADYEEFVRPMDTGWMEDEAVTREDRQGHYHRIEFRTDGIQTPFALVGYSVELKPLAVGSHAGRRA